MDCQPRLFAGHLGDDGNFCGLSAYSPGNASEGKPAADQRAALGIEQLFLDICRSFHFSYGFLGLGENGTDPVGYSTVGRILRTSISRANSRNAPNDQEGKLIKYPLVVQLF